MQSLTKLAAVPIMLSLPTTPLDAHQPTENAPMQLTCLLNVALTFLGLVTTLTGVFAATITPPKVIGVCFFDSDNCMGAGSDIQGYPPGIVNMNRNCASFLSHYKVADTCSAQDCPDNACETVNVQQLEKCIKPPTGAKQVKCVTVTGR